MGFADLHIHSVYSWDGTCTVSAILKYAADHTNLDVIAITDHDSIEGALEAVRIAPAYGIEVIPGCEISTSQGHLLAYDIHEAIPAGLTLIETLLLIGEQGGIAVAAHPQAIGMKSLTFSSIRNALLHSETNKILVGVESLNAGIFYRKSNRYAHEFAQRDGVAELGNSDSHILHTIGDGMTLFSGSSGRDLRWALENRRTRTITGKSATSGLGILGRWLPLYLLRTAGWVTWNMSPQSPLIFRRLEQNVAV